MRTLQEIESEIRKVNAEKCTCKYCDMCDFSDEDCCEYCSGGVLQECSRCEVLSDLYNERDEVKRQMTHKYRVESGPFVGQVDVSDGKIVAAPNVFQKFMGEELPRLTKWLVKINGTCSVAEIPTLAEIELPTYCGCNELLQDLQQLEAHVERGCWRKV